jgi:thiol:disulfide interchange protein
MQQFDMSIIELILYALLGGLILNLMPCVFPVLSLKALALLRSHESHRSEGWAYTVGILASFILIAITMIIIRAGGETIGWGFQLQEPKFVGAMVFILLAVGLSLSGFYTIQFGFESSGNSLTKSSGIKGSFFTGVLAALVATPCTAPFMAPAIGYAITQPMHITFIGFLALGFGLALPFLLLSYFPVLSNILPKPGPWMEKLKEALAFPMYITAAWLIWVFTNQAGSDATLMLLIGLILFAFAIWLWQQSTSKAVHILSVAVIIGSIFIAVPSTKDPTSQDVLDGEPYSEMRLNTLKKEGRRVFVYFSADWCITCKVNEQVSLYSDVNRALVFERNIAILKGDWTNRNETIAKVLASHKRMGVPLYLYYASGMDEPIILPEILGPNSVTDIFKEK